MSKKTKNSVWSIFGVFELRTILWAFSGIKVKNAKNKNAPPSIHLNFCIKSKNNCSINILTIYPCPKWLQEKFFKKIATIHNTQ